MLNYINFIRTSLILVLFYLGINSNFSKIGNNPDTVISHDCNLYDELQLPQLGLSEDIFDKAVTGWNTLFQKNLIQKPNLLSIADLSQSSNSKRLYVIDMIEKKVLFNTYVAHGHNSGEEFAHFFSNKPNSYKSSLGFYLTENTYEGANGLSLKLKGVERGINDDAEQRNIVMHGAPYVCESFIKKNGRLGRSQGCPAVPQELCEPLVNMIKEGSCFFMFYPDSDYLRMSTLL